MQKSLKKEFKNQTKVTLGEVFQVDINHLDLNISPNKYRVITGSWALGFIKSDNIVNFLNHLYNHMEDDATLIIKEAVYNDLRQEKLGHHGYMNRTEWFYEEMFATSNFRHFEQSAWLEEIGFDEEIYWSLTK